MTVAGLTIIGAQASDYALTQPTTTANISVAGLTVAGITAANKVYNASTIASLDTSSATLVGVYRGDVVILNTGGATGSFASQDVGTGVTVTVNGLMITGAQAADYALTQPTATASITPAALTVSGITAANKVYNASTTAALNTFGATLVGVFSGDTVNLNTGGATGTFASKDVATGVTVTVTGLTIGGPKAIDYVLTQPTTTASITPATLTISGITAANKVYNANTAATLNTTGAELVGVLIGDAVKLGSGSATGTFESKDVGTGIAVTVAGLTIGGAQASNYALAQPMTTASITPATLSVSGITATNKVYDGSTTAALDTNSATLAGVFSGDTVTLATGGASGTFASQHVGNGIAVTVAGLIISGAQARDYTLTQPTTTASITPATPAVSVSDSGATYKGSAFIATASVAGVGGQAGSQLEGVAPTPVYFAGSTATSTPLADAPIDAGTYTVVATFPGSTDYAASTSQPVTLSITAARPTVSVFESGSIYDGSAVNATATVTGVSGQAGFELEGVAPSPVYYAGSSTNGTALADAPVDAGTYTVIATFPGSNDYTPSNSAPVTFTIARATPSLGLSASGGEFDGSPFAASVTIAGSGRDSSPAASLDEVAPVLAYYIGPDVSAPVWARRHPARRGPTPSSPPSPAPTTTPRPGRRR